MDPLRFSAEEVLDMAIRIEENGEKFYSDAARMSKKDNVRELLNSLAQEEFKHKKYFMELKSSVKKAPLSFDPFTEDASLYVKALADSEVFTHPSEVVGVQDFEPLLQGEAPLLDFAIEREKDSLLFYYEIVKSVGEKESKTIEIIIEEEKSHLRKLSALKRELSGK